MARNVPRKRLQALDSVWEVGDEFDKCSGKRTHLATLLPLLHRAWTDPQHVRPHGA